MVAWCCRRSRRGRDRSLALELRVGSRRRLASSPSPEHTVRPPCPRRGWVFEDAALREQRISETFWMAHVAEPRQGLRTNLKIQAAGVGVRSPRGRPRHPRKFPHLSPGSPANLAEPASFLSLSLLGPRALVWGRGPGVTADGCWKGGGGQLLVVEVGVTEQWGCQEE